MGKVFTSAEIDINAKDKTGAGIKSASSKITELGKSLSSVGKKMSLFVTAPLVAMGVVALKNAASFEKQTVAFETLLGSAQRAKTLLKDIEDFAATTPFQMPGLLEGSKRLIAFGIGADEIVDKMTNLGNAAMGNQAILDRLTLAYGKLRAKGKATLEELNMFMEAGVPILDELAKMYDVTTQEMFEMISGGKIGFEQVDQALTNLTTGAGRFAGMIEKQSKTLSGLWSTLKDNFGILGREIMETVLPAFKKLVEKMTKLVMWFRDLNPQAKKMIVIIAGIAATMGPLLFVIGKLIAIAPALIGAISGIGAAMQIAMGPVGWITLAIAGAVTAAILLYKNWDKGSGWLVDIWYWLRDIAIQVWAKIGKILVTPLLLYLDAIIKITELFKKGEAEKLRGVYDKIAGSVDQAREHTEKYERKTWDVIRAERELAEEQEALMRAMESANVIIQESSGTLGDYSDDLEDGSAAIEEQIEHIIYWRDQMAMMGLDAQFYISAQQQMYDYQLDVNEAIDEGTRSVRTYSEAIGLLSEQTVNLLALKEKLKKEQEKENELMQLAANISNQYVVPSLQAFAEATGGLNYQIEAMIKTTMSNLLRALGEYLARMAVFYTLSLQFGKAALAAAGALAAFVAATQVKSLAQGGEFITNGPELILVGDNPGGRERVRAEPLSSPGASPISDGQPIMGDVYFDGYKVGKWMTHASRTKQFLTYKGAIVNV